MGLSTEFAKRSLDICADGAAAADRDFADLRKAAYIYLAVSEDGRRATDAVRRKLAYLFRLEMFAENIRLAGVDIDHEAIIAAVARGDLAAAERLVSDDAVEAFAMVGSPRQCRDRLEAYLDTGIDEAVLTIVGEPAERDLVISLIRDFASAR